MNDTLASGRGTTRLHGLDPRRSVATGIIWLVVALTASFALAASLWVGHLARETILVQHAHRLALETDQLGLDLSQAVLARLDALRAETSNAFAPVADTDAAALRRLFADLRELYPELDWRAVATADGAVVATARGGEGAFSVDAQPWFRAGREGLWLGSSRMATGLGANEATESLRGDTPSFGDVAIAARDRSGRVRGVVLAHLSWQRPTQHQERLTEAGDVRLAAQALVLNRDGLVIVGPDTLLGRPWGGIELARPAPPEAGGPHFERLAGGAVVLVARAPLGAANPLANQGWQVQLSEPEERVFQRADVLYAEIISIAVFLGGVTAAIGAVGAHRLTSRLRRLTLSAGAVGRGESPHIEVPAGHDEIAKLGAEFAAVLDDLQRERGELKAMSEELERRVSVRTREVERLAEESRYAAVGRERLKIARDLHDTLAHSMMAMLSEVRLLRKLQVHDPAALAEELARAEEVAHEGLKEARRAIEQMRVNAVRDTGLGAALAKSFERFRDRTGLAGEFSADAAAARVGDERAEIVFRMSEEVLRNIERHAQASRARMSLRAPLGTHLELCIEDDGIGFDPSAAVPGHFGLIGLREQAQLIGAELHIRSAPGTGTEVTIRLRITPETL
jgi:signal transduction histidine kinase